jgi:3-oxoacyl-[acyl-carrier-protein] synthase-3
MDLWGKIMKFENVGIKSFGYFLPDQVLTSNEIEDQISQTYERLKMAPGRLELMTGIKERRFWSPGTAPSQLSYEAAKLALRETPKEEIDLLIHTSVCRDFLEPATASLVHQKLGLSPSCTFFDLSNACLGFLNAMEISANLIECGKIKNALIVSGENSGPLLLQTLKNIKENPNLSRKEVKKLFANFTIGSAAVAFILSKLGPDYPKLLGGSSLVDSSASHLCKGSGDINSLMMETDSEKLMEKGIALAANNWDKTQNIIGKVDWVLTHQVGLAHEKALRENLKIEDIKTFSTYPDFGNTGSCALPLTLLKLAESGQLKKGDTLGLLGIGSGLSSLMLGVKW